MANTEFRLVLTVKDFDRATAFFRDALGLKQLAAFENDGGHAVLLDGPLSSRHAGAHGRPAGGGNPLGLQLKRALGHSHRDCCPIPSALSETHDLHRRRHRHGTRLGAGQAALFR